jgi:hypothetical protein
MAVMTHAEITTLAQWRDAHGVEVTADPAGAPVPGFVRLMVTSSKMPALTVPVSDEFNDGPAGSTLLRLVLIQRAFDGIEYEADAAAWARSESLDPGRSDVLALYQETLTARSRFLAAYGAIPDVIVQLDWELNAGAAQALREGRP